jgi:anhydro-N-acetylmuramic acid kinase
MSAITIRLERSKVIAIGLMSGTSHDGVSAVVVEIDERSRPPARLIAFQTFPYPARLRKELLAASADEKIGAAAISTLNFALGRELGRAAIEIARRASVALSDVAFIGSHGHTFFHLPPRRAARGQIASTLQLGESAVIAAATGVPVVADFRAMDVALGGEGAPLAPLAHLWLLADPKRGRVVQKHRRHRQRDLHSARRASRRPRPDRFRHRPGQRHDRRAGVANLGWPHANGS